MNKKLLFIAIGAVFSLPSMASVDIKTLAPNQFDCTVDELELYIMKRTENLRKESSVATWEDFKKTAQAMKSSGGGASNSPANGSSAASVSNQITQTGGESGAPADDCPLFFEDLGDIDMSGFEIGDFGDLGNLFSGGLDSLTDLANQQMDKLAESLTSALKEGICKRLSSDYLTKLGTRALDDALKTNIGYTTGDITGGNFANQVINDRLVKEQGDSNAKLWNVMDESLNDDREKYVKRQLKKEMDEKEDSLKDKAKEKFKEMF